jgi:hypothetical protein
MFVGALVLMVAATMVYGMGLRPTLVRATPDPTPPPTVTGDTICVVNSTQCLDLQGDQFVVGNPIVFYGIDPTEERFRWNLALPYAHAQVTYDAQTKKGSPFHDGELDQYYQGDPIYFIEKSIPTGHEGCIGLQAQYAGPYLAEYQTCGAVNTEWVQHDKYFVNVDVTNINGAKAVMSENIPAPPYTCVDTDGVQVATYQQPDTACNVQFDIGLHE